MLHVKAPLIIWPQNFQDKNSTVLIGDLGKINFSTVVRPSQPLPGDKQVQEDDFYDKFNINLSSLQVTLTANIGIYQMLAIFS